MGGKNGNWGVMTKIKGRGEENQKWAKFETRKAGGICIKQKAGGLLQKALGGGPKKK